MRASPQSSVGSLSPTSPTLLHPTWSSSGGGGGSHGASNGTTSTPGSASLLSKGGSVSSNGLSPGRSSTSSNEEEFVDDDLFGSAAWKRHKRRTVGKRGHGHGHSPGQGPSPEGEGSKVKERVTRRWRVLRMVEQRAWAARSHVLAARDRLDGALASVLSFFSSSASGVRGGNSGGPRAQGVTSSTLSSSGPPEVGTYELTTEALVQQTRLLCGNYIYHRLSSKGLMSKRVHVVPCNTILAEEVCSACQELERLYPRIYNDVSRRISMTMTSAQLVRRALTSVLEGIFRSGVTWAKVVSMVAMASAFAEECVVQGHPNFVEDVVMCVGHFATMNLTGWFVRQGGWAAFPMSRPPVVTTPVSTSPSLTLALVVLGISLVVFLVSKTVLDVS